MLTKEKNKLDFTSTLDMLRVLTSSLLKSRYRKTFAGFFWVIINPIVTFVVQALIFRHILKVEVQNYYLFLLSGVIPWVFISSTLNMTASYFITNRQNLLAFKVKPWIFIAAQVIDNLITFVASFLILLLLNGELEVLWGFKIPMFIFASFIFSCAVFSLSFLMSTLNVFFRDTQFILQFALNIGYFVTPIFYPIELIPESFRWIIKCNPLYVLIKPFQSIFWNYDLNKYVSDIGVSLALTLCIGFVAFSYWRKKEHEIYFRI